VTATSFERILVAIDGSPRGAQTIEIAVGLATRYGAKVTVVHVREYERYEGDDVDMGPNISAEDLVEQGVREFSEAGVEAVGVVRRVRSNETAQQIVDVAQEAQADLIVMGTRGMTEWRSLLLGGVANKVVHHATCPVLLVR
jgi:nucleotide-binding universal stress UspA family protein